jgi:aspartate/methionine/tyrosine aminotransferase
VNGQEQQKHREMSHTPVNKEIVDQLIKKNEVRDFGQTKIRDIVRLVNQIQEATGMKYIRMEMGVPGLPPPAIGVEAEVKALRKGKASLYPMIEGIPELKKEISRFAKLFLNIEASEERCVPTVGSMQGALASFLVANRNDRSKEGTLFIDPGFPVQKQQCYMLGHTYESFDVYDYRGDKLGPKLESILKKGKTSSILYSNPNNPAWICFSDDELRTIGEVANKYDTIVIEDLAYFGMDFRKPYGKPGVPPYIPTVGHYTDHYILLMSSSKSFSYAGQRVAMMVMSEKLYNRHYPDLKRYYLSDKFGYSMIYGALYALSSGTAHTPQYGLAAILKAVNDGDYDFVAAVSDYAEKAKVMKKLFTSNGFEIVYDMDDKEAVGDGFYFTVSYPGMSGGQLLSKLIYYGISAISLQITGSKRTEGIRACVSQVGHEQFNDLEQRLAQFRKDNPITDKQ